MAEIRNRRRGPDAMTRSITGFSIFSWVLIIAALIFFQMTGRTSGSYNAVRSTFFSFETGVMLAKALLFLNTLLCIVGMFVNMARNKRKTDRFRVSLIVSFIVSLAGFILMVAFF